MEQHKSHIGDLLPMRATARPGEPQFVLVPRPAGSLACGDLAREPVLGPARITDVGRAGPYVHLAWADERGPSTASARYPADQEFAVRAPHPVDRLKIERAIERATWAKRAVRGDAARLIAAHLNRGPGTALGGFTMDGAVTVALYDELEQVDAEQPIYRPWVQALVRYCLDRDYQGPLSGWGPAMPSEQPPAAQRLAPAPQRRRRTAVDLMAKKLMPTETARQLIDAAFTMGLTASRNELVAAKARWIIRHCITGEP
ncbi:hypothetical protein RB614_00825 [Phytohabitans sp. ZYX-F-186]|uniref:Uncharacterized protein n=1 Tax=Phytohabitans maris TaxID=3071409 RepID=A0ABU0Z7M7_9ACTN|nr:hypothetical protein [Phytohabitans sp. ZYX-F-186]MDQ7903063.1 hypothetical protein [Phytohabitans sp. ZYX-F-186]